MALLSDSTAVVTGASSGNGRAIAQTFAEHGADVVVADIREEPRLDGKPTHELIEDTTDASSAFVECDVTSIDDLEKAIDEAEEFGTLDIMVNNAGIVDYIDFLEASPEDYERVMMVNAFSTYFGSKAAAERMLETGGGSIINLASINADYGDGGDVAYSASKGAVKSMTYALADALGPDIRVNAIHPGPIKTAQISEDMEVDNVDNLEEQRKGRIPLERFGKPQDIGNVALFLASDLAGWVSAQSITVDGGMMTTY